MAKKKKKNGRQQAPKKNNFKPKVKLPKISLPEETKKWIWGILIFVIAAVLFLSFFDRAGTAGNLLKEGIKFLIGKTFYLTPFVFIVGGIIFFTTKYKKFFGPTLFAIIILILGISGILGGNTQELQYHGSGGSLGYLVSFLIVKYFGLLVSNIVFLALMLFGLLTFWYLLKPQPGLSKKDRDKDEPTFVSSPQKETSGKKQKEDKESSLIKKILFPQFKIKGINDPVSVPQPIESKTSQSPSSFNPKIKETAPKPSSFAYQTPPIDLLEGSKELPTSGDTKINQAVIKKTLQNFDIPVEMAEVNIGPTVTQYSFKPAEGVKLSKITGLSNDLSLALAAHPIRIEAPIPGRSLVGVEIPNRIRAKVGLKELVANPIFQTSPANLNLVLGRDVSGNPVYSDLAKMPHLLVAGSTGSGKTIFLNTLVLSLIYRNSPEMMSLILIDPKRVEFPVFNDLPHLLAPVILDAHRAVNALKWLISEMERRFQVLSAVRARDIISYNQQIQDKTELLPYIVLVVDELADLMAAKGKEMEAGIVRLAQMSRAVGIHLVLATQRPSVEVITGLIKANVTTRVTFQVASQVDSRTIIDMAGAEKLLGRGDMLFLSSELGKPRRVQAAFVSDKAVKKVANYIKSKNERPEEFLIGDDVLNGQREDLEGGLGMSGSEFNGDFGEDSLYEDAKRVVIESKKASASLLQRRLRIGYARAARLIDILEERGIIGPGEGAKPREVYGEAGFGVGREAAAADDGFVPIDISSEEEAQEEGAEEVGIEKAEEV